jgi:hypothetical protein
VGGVGRRWPAGPAGNPGDLGQRRRNVTARRVLLAATMVLTIAALAGLTGCSGGKNAVSTGPLSTTEPATAPIAPTTDTTSTTSSGAHSGSTGVTVTAPPTTKGTTVTTPTTLRSANSPPVQVQLSSADFGRTVPVRVGDTIRLLLDDQATRWEPVSESRPGLLAPAPAPKPPTDGQLVIWTAMHPGSVTVKSTGFPVCAVNMACPMYARLFEVTIVIS